MNTLKASYKFIKLLKFTKLVNGNRKRKMKIAQSFIGYLIKFRKINLETVVHTFGKCKKKQPPNCPK